MKRTYLILFFALSCCSTMLLAQNRETVHLQTDRSVYVSGETVFFKMYVLDAVTGKTSRLSKVGYLVLRAPKVSASIQLRVAVSDGVGSGSFQLPDSLPSNVYQLVAFTAYMRNEGEDAFAHRILIVANRVDRELNFQTTGLAPESDSVLVSAETKSDSSIWITTDKLEYDARESVVFRLNGNVTPANLTVSVLEEPALVLQEPSSNKTSTTLTSGRYLPESPSKILRGNVLDANTNQPIRNATVMLSCPDTVPNLQYDITNVDGLLQLQLGPYYEGKLFFLTIKDVPTGQHWRLELQSNFELTTPWTPELRPLERSAREYLKKCQEIARINRAFASKNEKVNQTPTLQAAICPRLYYQTVETILPADFVPLDSFPEIAVELLPSLKIYRQDGSYHAHTITAEQQFYGRNETSVFVDGVYLDLLDKIMPLTSEKIRKIDVIKNKRAFGDLVFYGILSIQTTSNEILRMQPAPHSLRIKNDGMIQSFRTVEPPLPSDARTPYYKQLLYWNPSGQIQTEYKVQTSDRAGTFQINMEGITQDGRLIRATARIQVNKPQTATEP